MKKTKRKWLRDEHYQYTVVKDYTDEKAKVWNDGIGELTGVKMVKDRNSGVILLRVSNHLGKAFWQVTKLGMLSGVVAMYLTAKNIKDKICS